MSQVANAVMPAIKSGTNRVNQRLVALALLALVSDILNRPQASVSLEDFDRIDENRPAVYSQARSLMLNQRKDLRTGARRRVKY